MSRPIRVEALNCTRSPITGAYIVSALVNDYRMQRTFYGYTKRTAVALFRQEAARG